jgi:hypothetical protein
MSFTIEEASLESGSPIELYDIVIGSTTYYLCSCAGSYHDGRERLRAHSGFS